MTNFHFIRPYFLLFLVPAVLFVWKLLQGHQQANNWKTVCDEHLLPHILLKPKGSSSLLPLMLLSLAWLITVIAIAGPTWKQISLPAYRALNSRVIVLDLSTAMLAKDIKPNRLQRAKFKIQDIIKHSKESQLGMVAFTSKAFVVSPLTTDGATISTMVPQLDPAMMPVLGSELSAGLKKAGDLLQQAGAKRGEIILITAGRPDRKAYKQAEKLKAKGYVISVLGIGTRQGAPISTRDGFLTNNVGDIVISKLSVSGLTKLAKLGGGRYYRFTADNKDINDLLSKRFSGLTKDRAKTKVVAKQWYDQGGLLTFLLLPLVILIFRRGWFEWVLQ